MTPTFDKTSLNEAFGELASILYRRGKNARIYVAGGAAMIMAHAADRLTRDIDSAIEEGYGPVMEAASEIAQRRGWPSTWINEAATAYMPPPDRRHGIVVFDHPALKVVAATRDHMLAMKVRAARPTDIQDVTTLLSGSGLDTPAQVEAVYQSVFPDEPLPQRQRRWVKSLFAALLHRSEPRRSAPPAPLAAPVVCGQKLGPKRTCRRMLRTKPCPQHPNSPGSRQVNRSAR